MSVEVVDVKPFAGAVAAFDVEEREHVTLYYYRHPELFRIQGFENERLLGDRSLTVDTPDDLARIERLLSAMDRPHLDYDCEGIIASGRALGRARPQSG